MNRTKIEWCDYTWNPVVGCKHNCTYCYARRMNDRFQWIPDWTKPRFYEDRMQEPSRVQNKTTIFVGSMCDLFGSWVPETWIRRIIVVAAMNPQHTFMFLTKNPKRYNEFVFPENSMLGMTFTGEPGNMREIQGFTDFGTVLNSRKFISAEPLLSAGILYRENIERYIIGAMTGGGAIRPEKAWIQSIQDRIPAEKIFFKENIKDLI